MEAGAALCAAAVSSPAPWAQTAKGVGLITAAVVVELEIFGTLSRSRAIPTVLSRKLTHIFAGLGTSLLLVRMPPGFWPARLAVSSVLFAFMAVFAWIAEMPEASYQRLPGLLRAKVDSMVSNMCRHGTRRELADGTWYYSFIVSLVTVLFWTAPVNAILFATLFIGGEQLPIHDSLGSDAPAGPTEHFGTLADGLADPVGRTLGGLFRDPAKKKELAPMQYRFLNFGTKSIPGSLAFFLSSLGSSILLGKFYYSRGHWMKSLDFETFARVSLIACAFATFAEAVSPPGKDNLLVPLAVMVVCHYFESSGTAGLMTSCW